MLETLALSRIVLQKIVKCAHTWNNQVIREEEPSN